MRNDEESKAMKNKCCQLDVCRPDYPKRIFFIIGNEFCERFCFYGMRAILQTYLMIKLGLDANLAGSIYHAFAIVSYFMPLPGAIVADSFLGKYWTILSLSIVYAIGNIVMSTTTLGSGTLTGSLIGIFTIAVGTGGIKPCVSAFGADQFTSKQSFMRKSFFSMFYVSINAGALLGQLLTPSIKAVQCFGEESCWVFAFGLPALLMLVSIIFFVIGTPYYTRTPVKENVIVKMSGAVWTAIIRSRDKSRKGDYWLDRAVPDYSKQFCNDCRAVFHVLVLFLPLPFFWALFDQAGSRWTYQAQKMNTYIGFLNFHMQPEQVQTANSVLILCLVPVFDTFVYPILAKCHLLVRPLQRMVTGCALAAVSFFVIGAIQIGVQDGNDLLIWQKPSTFRTRVFNVNPFCSFELGREWQGKVDSEVVSLRPYDTYLLGPGKADNGTVLRFTNIKCTDASHYENKTHILIVDDSKPISTVFFDDKGNAKTVYANDSFPINDDGEPQKEFLFQILISSYTYLPKSQIKRTEVVEGSYTAGAFEPNQNAVPLVRKFTTGRLPSYYYKLKYWSANSSEPIVLERNLAMLQGGIYTAYLKEMENGTYDVELLQDKGENVMSAYLQFIPYFIITCAEILFSITGLAFAFSQAPASMKSMLIASWHLTDSFGNLIDMIIIAVSIENKAREFFLFAFLMVAVTIVFSITTCFYQYVEDIDKVDLERQASCGPQENDALFSSTTRLLSNSDEDDTESDSPQPHNTTYQAATLLSPDKAYFSTSLSKRNRFDS